ncbi:hypothetical protein KIN20_017964 [Parelaphostrongylus tenuis]|uniref:Uncharacterized protein n=1 Tax=Parelaphostrongylus tenuis TaxID=148309 RepID=A0AAD5QRV2_PARTN|nr:hypothetical protein KIN20_017964 [Parelaphostrongylus tenuis]
MLERALLKLSKTTMQTAVCRAEPQSLCVVPRQPLVLVPVRDLKITAMSSSMMSPAPKPNRGPRPILPRTSAPRPPETPTSEGLSYSADTSRRGKWILLSKPSFYSL